MSENPYTYDHDGSDVEGFDWLDRLADWMWAAFWFVVVGYCVFDVAERVWLAFGVSP